MGCFLLASHRQAIRRSGDLADQRVGSEQEQPSFVVQGSAEGLYLLWETDAFQIPGALRQLGGLMLLVAQRFDLAQTVERTCEEKLRGGLLALGARFKFQIAMESRRAFSLTLSLGFEQCRFALSMNLLTFLDQGAERLIPAIHVLSQDGLLLGVLSLSDIGF